MQTIKLQTLPFLSAGRTSRNARLACRAQLPRPVTQQQNSVEQASLALAASLLTASPALADETAAAAANAGASSPGPGFLFAFAPIVVYGAFYLYREKVNPRAKIGDLLFFFAAAVILANIVSILVFKIRLY